MALDHPHDALPPGYRLGAYEILRVLGRGGFGFTYQARRSGTVGDMVAIKELFPASTATRARDQQVIATPGADEREVHDSAEMFLREAELICSLDHPHIVQGLDAFRANGTAYLVMRYVSGRNLRDSLRDPAGFRPSPKTLPGRFAKLLDALETLHGHGLLHCDIKPDNIFLGIDHEPILIDLGSARWHVPGVGTEGSSTYSHYFSAIEQVTDRFGPIGPWTDIYQISAVLYRCVSGGKLPDAIDRLDKAGDPYLPLAQLSESRGYRAALINGIDHGLRLLPKHRPQCVSEWRTAMGASIPEARIAHGAKPVKAQRPDPHTATPGSRIPHPTRPTDPLVLVAGGLLAIILILVFLLIR